jgi:YD repeat-containing protein
MTFNKYDSKGNLVEITGKNGIPTTTIWGYYQTQPIAQITGVTYNQIAALPSVIAAVNASNADADNPANEASLLQALENLRKDPALQSRPVAVYTYDPLIGTTQSVSANGVKLTYIYDPSNRLIKTTDSEGKTIKEYQYNYKH